MANAEALRMQFQQMSAARDQPVQSQTEIYGYDTDDGYIQEVVSSSPVVSRRSSNEDFQTVTRRVTKTSGSGGAVHTMPPLNTVPVVSPRDTGISPPPKAPAMERPVPPPAHDGLPPSVSYEPYGSTTPAGGMSTRSLSTTSSAAPVPVAGGIIPGGAAGTPQGILRSVSPHGPHANWVRREEPMYEPRSVSHASPKTVTYGTTNTTVIEPSRISPLSGVGGYAPVKYISRRDYKRMQRERAHAEGRSLAGMVRSSSVPRLDEENHGTRGFAAYGSGSGERQGSNGRYGSPGSSALNGAAPYQSRQPYDDDQYAAYPPQQHHQPRGRNPTPRSVVPDYGMPPAPSGTIYEDRDEWADVRRQSPLRRPNSVGRMSAGSGRESVGRVSMARSNYSTATTAADLPNTGTTIENVGQMLAMARNTQQPAPPAYGVPAFKLLNRGTYLVKYPARGSPHERWCTIRLVRDEETGRTGPYLLWCMHAESVSFIEKLHLSHLVEVREGPKSQGFMTKMATPTTLIGPHVGAKRSELPTDFCFTLVFRSMTNARAVDLLAMDDQTYGCWLLVCRYFAQINSGAMDVQPQAPSLAPGTPRGESEASQR